ncbi:MAG: hypothetical protein LBV27_01440 [Oscillospiraceae bacterium]|jgi:hypothetical protein|nr:hypothetical protein [Oscillospiraceae bacterium]
MATMISVIIAAQKHNKLFWATMHSILEKNFTAIHAYERKLKADSGTFDLIVTDIDSFDSIQSDDTIIIFKDPVDIDIGPAGDHKAVAVVDSCNEKLLPLVASTRLPAITCGLSAKDTLTLSSMRLDSAVINLQRSVTCFDGSVAEPQEIPVSLNTVTMDNDAISFALMAVASICILSGQIERLHSIKI